ncbi:MAG: hypothetical protein IT190_08635 [Microbacteriaceae bacterium]|nr:hypothetical protein [Microbacteriaceae bacterium]
MNIKFKSQIQKQERMTIQQINDKITLEYKNKRKQNMSQKIWERNCEENPLKATNPNLCLSKRQLASNFNISSNTDINFGQRKIMKSHTRTNLKEENSDIEQLTKIKAKTKLESLLTSMNPATKSSKYLDSIVKSPDKGVLFQALSILNKRKEDQENNPIEKKDTVFNTVEKVNDIYIIDLTTKMINEEIERLKKLEIEKKQKIKNIEKSKELEFIKFRENFEKIKKITEMTIEQSNDIAHRKTVLIKEIKNKSQIQGILKHDTKKLEDLASYYSELKKFLNLISPDYFREKKAKDMLTK